MKSIFIIFSHSLSFRQFGHAVNSCHWFIQHTSDSSDWVRQPIFTLSPPRALCNLPLVQVAEPHYCLRGTSDWVLQPCFTTVLHLLRVIQVAEPNQRRSGCSINSGWVLQPKFTLVSLQSSTCCMLFRLQNPITVDKGVRKGSATQVHTSFNTVLHLLHVIQVAEPNYSWQGCQTGFCNPSSH